jgi:hypothetical protein
MLEDVKVDDTAYFIPCKIAKILLRLLIEKSTEVICLCHVYEHVLHGE